MDNLTSEQRRKNMQHIKGRDTKPEIVLRRALWKKGYRYRKNYKDLPGKPDIVLTKYRICIFVDSEYFHGKDFESGYHSSKYSSLRDQIMAGNHADFWLSKIEKNMERDRQVETELRTLGWNVIRFWSKDVLKHTDQCIKVIEEYIFSSSLNKQ
ncbi:MAG: very short patch repair endonuclease [Clostridia bacterium]|nr:very short patch repair endonuclease [Clostridia bacterium]MDY5555595.1 very short patch repair endonuclease [Blautia sp.]